MAAVLVWGVSFICTKVLMNNQFNPVEVYVFRCAIAYVLLLVLSHDRIRARNWQHELLFLVCGLCGGSVYFVAENTSLLYTTTTNVSLITSTAPLITAFLVGLIYKDERPNRGIVIGSIVAFVGVVTVVLNSAPTHGEDSNATASLGHKLLGDGLAFFSAVCWCLYSLLLRKLNAVYSALYITRKTFFYGLLSALPFLLLEPTKLTAATFCRAEVWVNLLILAVFASSLGFAVWAWVVGRLGAVRAGNYLYFQPGITLFAAALLLHDPLNPMVIAGCVLTVAGVYLGDRLSARIQAGKR
jgi:drug/metabolite transporter (DMT)-like permease